MILGKWLTMSFKYPHLQNGDNNAMPKGSRSLIIVTIKHLTKRNGLFHSLLVSTKWENFIDQQNFVMLKMFSVIYHILAAFIKIFLFWMKRNSEDTEVIKTKKINQKD